MDERTATGKRRILRIGLIGCGEITQIVHIPTLRQLSGLFTVTGVCDASAMVTNAVAAEIPGATPHVSVDSLLADDTVDAVLVATPNPLHAAHAIAALRAGKHVVIEKPMCMTLTEADRLADVEAETGLTVQIGYMRRYAPAFVEAVDLLAPLRGEINFARVRDMVGRNPDFMASISNVLRSDDIPSDQKSAVAAAQSAALHAAIGVDEGPRARTYGMLLGLSTHDISAMRELIGRPERVLAAASRRGGSFITATFDYAGFVCHFETGIDKVPRFDTSLEVMTPHKLVRVDYDTPYIRHQQARLTVTENRSTTGVSVRQSYASRQDSFVPQWEHFYDCVNNGAMPKTGIADARQDLEIFAEIMSVLDS